MLLYRSIITLLWFVAIVYWSIAAFNVKKSAPRNARWFAIRILFFVIFVVVVRSSIFTNFDAAFIAHSSSALGFIGTVLCAGGIALAIWARVYLGENWGMPSTTKEDTELVTSGPYKYIRHPIYSGVILAMLGSAFAGDGIWLIVFIIFTLYYIYNARIEESNMMWVFPEQYREYKKKTKMLIPFIF